MTIRVEGVSKKYCRNLKRSLRYGLKELARELLLRQKPQEELRRDEFWALRDINFEVRRGESLGIVGVNGSGKTTLLNMLNGLLKPTKGSITVRGRVGAMIQLGAGFQPLLSGRENIYINAAILGMTRQEIQQKLDDIIEFADIGEFIDAPVQTYSKGMKMRLGFSVATRLVNPDVLIIDEVLATGDIAFRSKCQKRINEIVDSGSALVLVSHSIGQIEALCQKTLFLNKGSVQAYGPTPDVIQEYLAFAHSLALEQEKSSEIVVKQGSNSSKARLWQHADPRLFEVINIEILNELRLPQERFQILEPLVIRLHFVAHQPIKGLVVRFSLANLEGVDITSFKTRDMDSPDLQSGTGYVDCIVPELPLREGPHLVHAAVARKEGSRHTGQILFKSEAVAEFSIQPNSMISEELGYSGLVYTPVEWSFSASDISFNQSSNLSKSLSGAEKL